MNPSTLIYVSELERTAVETALIQEQINTLTELAGLALACCDEHDAFFFGAIAEA